MQILEPKTYFIADPHFGHRNVIDYDNRPYTSVEEMDEDMIHKWNEVVTDSDIIWVLGDLAMSTNKEYLKKLISRLRGRKRLILGNHDKCKDNFYRECGFEFVSKYPVILHDFFVLSHEPIQYMSENCPFFFIYGHVHNSEVYHTATKHTRCVSTCRQGYQPIEVPEYSKYVEEKLADCKKIFEVNCR